MYIENKKNITQEFLNDNNLISKTIEKSIKNNKWHSILFEMPTGSFLVGGYIRDLLLGRLSKKPDIDIVVTSSSLEVGKNIAIKFKRKFILLDKVRGIVRVFFDDFTLDIASLVGFSLEEDLKKRDFTINSIAFCLNSKIIFDPEQGIKHLNQSIIKTANNQNLYDDPLRILRSFRFASELGFTIDKNLILLIKKIKYNLKNVSVERIQYELRKTTHGKDAPKVVLLLNELKIFSWIQIYKKNKNLVMESINIKIFKPEEISKYITFVYLNEILNATSIKKLNFSKREIYNCHLLKKWRIKIIQKSINEFNEIERFDLHLELENILPAFIVYLPQEMQENWLKRWRDTTDKLFHPTNMLNGETIKSNLQIQDGPLLGELLKYLSVEYAFNRLSDFDEAIYKAKDWFQQNAPKCD